MATSVARLVRSLARRTARAGPFGRTVARVTNAVGMTGLSRRVSDFADFVPEHVPFDVIDRRGRHRRGIMHGAGGRDVVVKTVWLAGLEEWERPLPAVYAAAVRGTDGAVLEVGANSGLYAVMACLLDDPGRVHAFEPFPPALKSLEANLDLNGLRSARPAPAVVARACGAEPGEATLYIPAQKHGEMLETSASLRFDFKGQHSGSIAVPVTTIDRYIAEAELDRVGLMKLDVEGFEGPAMRGAAETLRTKRPLVFVEVVAWKSEAPELEGIRARSGYRAVSLEGNRMVERPAVQVCPNGDNQLWYPEESRDLFLRVAGAAKVPVQTA